MDAAAGSEVTLTDVTGEKLAAGVVGWECKAKVTLHGKPPAAKCR